MSIETNNAKCHFYLNLVHIQIHGNSHWIRLSSSRNGRTSNEHSILLKRFHFVRKCSLTFTVFCSYWLNYNLYADWIVCLSSTFTGVIALVVTSSVFVNDLSGWQFGTASIVFEINKHALKFFYHQMSIREHRLVLCGFVEFLHLNIKCLCLIHLKVSKSPDSN